MKTHATIAVTLLLSLLAGCTSLWQDSSGTTRKGVSSSLVSYLYPSGEEPPPYAETLPLLELPLRVGIAFVPSTDYSDIPGFTEASKISLLEKVKAQFLDRDYIADIQVIPETYLRGTRGFSGLEQVGRMYQLDLVALVSYDQVVTSDDTKASILYWTIVGAYFIEGSQNDVQTFVDTAIFDIKTRKLLLRAPGIDGSTQKSTLVESNKELRDERGQSFDRAMTNMTAQLQIELDNFETRLQEDSTIAQVDRSGMSGGGASGPVSVLAMLLLFLLRAKTRFLPGNRLSVHRRPL